MSTLTGTHVLNDLLRALRTVSEDRPESEWGRWIHAAMTVEKMSGGLSVWANFNDSLDVMSMSADFTPEGRVKRLAFESPRNMVWNPMGARLYRSNNEWDSHAYRGLKTLAMTPETYVGWDEAKNQVHAYHRVIPSLGK